MRVFSIDRDKKISIDFDKRIKKSGKSLPAAFLDYEFFLEVTLGSIYVWRVEILLPLRQEILGHILLGKLLQEIVLRK